MVATQIFFHFHPDPWGFMIQFDKYTFFKNMLKPCWSEEFNGQGIWLSILYYFHQFVEAIGPNFAENSGPRAMGVYHQNL